MSAPESPAQTAHAAGHPHWFHPGFGERLRRGREALGWGVADVAAKLKLSERQIEAIEAEDFAQLPGEIFCRGFIRNYARLVQVAVDQLIVPVDVQASVAETITAPSEGVNFASPGLRRWVLMPLLGMGLFVLLVALLYYWLRQGEHTLVGESSPVPASVEPAQTTVVPVPIAPQPPASVRDAAPALPAPAVSAPMAAAPPAEPVTPASAVSPATPAVAHAPEPKPAQEATPTTTAAPANHAHALRFAPTLDAWIQVVDSGGKRFSKLVRAGSVEVFAGKPPFNLVVGEAAAVNLTYNGYRIDLTPFIGQKVARLTLE